MKQQNFKSDDFEVNIAIGIIKSNTTCVLHELVVQSVRFVDDRVIVNYEINKIKAGDDTNCDTQFQQNSLFLINKGNYTKIEFYEDNVFMKEINL